MAITEDIIPENHMLDTHQAMRTIFERAKPHMTAHELSEVGSVLTNNAIELSRRMHEVTQGIACLVASDGEKSVGAGNFQNADQVFDLLCAVSEQFDAIAGMIDVGSEATSAAERIRAQRSA